VTTRPPPPSRYRVVEKGRRLVVIDTRTGEAPTRVGRDAVKDLPLGPERIAFDGRSVLVTRRFYDDKAPRRLTLDEGATRWLEGARSLAIGGAVLAVVLLIFLPWLALVVIPVAALLLRRQGRAALRALATRWLDRYDASAG